MVAPVETTITYQPITEDIQNLVIALVKQKTIAIAMDVMQTLITAQLLKPQELVARYITPREKELSELDERTSKMMLKFLAATNEMINNLPGSTMTGRFEMLAQVTGRPTIRDDFVKSLALDHVKSFVKAHDEFNPEIVNRLIRPDVPAAEETPATEQPAAPEQTPASEQAAVPEQAAPTEQAESASGQ